MPEEINRILTDEITDYFFVTEKSGLENLTKEKKSGKQFFVGNTMIDTLVANEENISKSTIVEDLSIESEFVLMTIHRPSNVDSKEGLSKLIELLKYLDNKLSVVFPIHPRTIAKLKEFGFYTEIEKLKNLVITEPLGYFEFQKLVKDCKFVMTDSGGIQEETTFRQKACLTLRENTERPSTVEIGTNTLVSFDVEILKQHIDAILEGNYKKGQVPELWDGKATERILDVIASL
jgi:UDP-N-acetylglucosamine 2-epimerase (non-hydrolysing)